MSSIAFKQHIAQLISDLTRCSELCDVILVNRRTGNKHESLDRLQAGFTSSANAIGIEFNTLRKLIGSRMDLGDDTARRAIKANIRTLELDIERRLEDIANRRNDGLPGFRDMLREVQMIEESVSATLETLGQRLENPPEDKAKKEKERKEKEKKERQKEKEEKEAKEKKEKKEKEKKNSKKPNEIVVNLKEFEKYTDHMKNSWTETIVAGKILYVNQWDEMKNQWERPSGGFIQALPTPAKVPRTPSWDEPPRRRVVRQPSWERRSPDDWEEVPLPPLPRRRQRPTTAEEVWRANVGL